MDVSGKRVTIIGLGVTGISSAKLLISRGAKVGVSDSAVSDEIRARASELRQIGARVEVGRHTRDFVAGSDFVVASPGVSVNSAVLKMILEDAKIPIIGEIELASSLFRGEIVAITGTNGKTTVTTLVGEILRDAGKDVVVCGNIGNPFSGEVEDGNDGKIAVLEVSSFQLEWIAKFKPRVSVILNVTDDHLDRYQDFDQYLSTKARIFINQTEEDFCCLNVDDPGLRKLVSRPRAKVLTFGQNEDRSDPNEKAAMLVGSIYGIDEGQMAKTVDQFKGIEHRLEYIAAIDGIRFVNDSKATNPAAVCWALKMVKEPIILLAGGRDKGCCFGSLKSLVQARVKLLVLFGEAKEKMRKDLGGLVPIKEAETFQEAFGIARRAGRKGDCVLLSPGCASFDMFSNFEERGKAFKELVRGCEGRG